MISVSMYFGHECGLALFDHNTREYTTLEFEKLTGKRYMRDVNVDQIDTATIKWYLMVYFNFQPIRFHTAIIDKMLMDRPANIFHQLLAGKYKSRIEPAKHHMAHAALGFYTSPFDKAVIIAADGGGEQETLTINVAHNRTDKIQKLESRNDNPNLGAFYLACASFCGEIMHHGNYMTWPGKAMGLCARGKVRDEWYDPLYRYATENTFWGVATVLWPWRKKFYKVDAPWLTDALDGRLKLHGQDSYDFMATAQKVMEDIFAEITDPYIQAYPGYDIVLSGGIALNVLNNEKVKLKYKDRRTFVPAAPGDSGLALGRMLDAHKPQKQVKAAYLGPLVLNEMPTIDEIRKRQILRGVFNIDKGVYERFRTVDHQRLKISDNSVPITKTEIAQMLADGKIVGAINGRSEFGPRALGSRSILCDPSYPGMRDKINKNIKSREWYRPFAPVCRLEDAETYFDSCQFEFMDTMAFAPLVRPEWRDKLPSITHEDGTARLQTVKQEDQPWLYELLTEFQKVCGREVLLNTSFNVKGKSILNDIVEGVVVLESTDLDALIYEDRMMVV